jgi:hypothetical protein
MNKIFFGKKSAIGLLFLGSFYLFQCSENTPKQQANKEPIKAAPPIAQIKMPDPGKVSDQDTLLLDPQRVIQDTLRKKTYKFPEPTKAPSKISAGPTGYITQEKVNIYPAIYGKGTGVPIKRYEGVVILETSMSDASGKSYEVPQWYKIQRSNQKVGWVEARFVTLN